jgi:hypothetical protein
MEPAVRSMETAVAVKREDFITRLVTAFFFLKHVLDCRLINH